MAKVSARERFWRYVTPADPATCWEWQGGKTGPGYGQIRDDDKRQVYAHRLSYEMHKGPIPTGLHLDHLCRNRACVNPAHLEAVTQRENNRRGHTPWGDNARKTHCANGHLLCGSNVRIDSRGARLCVVCAAHRTIGRAGLHG